MKIQSIKTNQIINNIFGGSKKSTVKEAVISPVQDNSNKKLYISIALASLGAVGLAAFAILSHKKLNAKQVNNIKNEIENSRVDLPKHNDGVKSTLPIVEKSASILKTSNYDFIEKSYDLENVASEIPVDSSAYNFLKRNTKGFYLEYGMNINKFLRSSELKSLPVINEEMPEALKQYFSKETIEIKNTNRAIVDSVKRLDEAMTSTLEEATTVYRDAPKQWLQTAQNGILEDKAFVSTSTKPGASLEGMIGPNAKDNIRYEIRLPQGTKFLDLRYTSEKEILLPRDSKFKIVDGNILELIL